MDEPQADRQATPEEADSPTPRWSESDESAPGVASGAAGDAVAGTPDRDGADASPDVEVVEDIPVSVIRTRPTTRRAVEGFSSKAVETTVAAGLGGVRMVARATGAVLRGILASRPAKVVGQLAGEAAAAVWEETGDELEEAARVWEERFSKVVAIVVPVVVGAIDPDDIVERLDLNAVLAQVDFDEVLEQVDLDVLLDRIDVNHVLDRVDVNRLLDRVDVNRLLDRVDVNRLMDRVDVEAITERVKVGGMVTEGAGEMAGSAVDLARRQGVGVDVVIARTINRILGRDPERMPVGPPRLVGDEPDTGGKGEAE